MRYFVLNPRRSTLKITPEELDRLLREDEEPLTVRRPDFAAAWAEMMNAVPETVKVTK